jgi:hypothetical protein
MWQEAESNRPPPARMRRQRPHWNGSSARAVPYPDLPCNGLPGMNRHLRPPADLLSRSPPSPSRVERRVLELHQPPPGVQSGRSLSGVPRQMPLASPSLPSQPPAFRQSNGSGSGAASLPQGPEEDRITPGHAGQSRQVESNAPASGLSDRRSRHQSWGRKPGQTRSPPERMAPGAKPVASGDVCNRPAAARSAPRPEPLSYACIGQGRGLESNQRLRVSARCPAARRPPPFRAWGWSRTNISARKGPVLPLRRPMQCRASHPADGISPVWHLFRVPAAPQRDWWPAP